MKKLWVILLVVSLLVMALPARAQDCEPGSPGCYCLGCDVDLFVTGSFRFAVPGDTFPPYIYTVPVDTVAYWLPGWGRPVTLAAGTDVTITARVYWTFTWLRVDNDPPLYIRE